MIERCVGIEIAAQRFNGLGNPGFGIILGALEDHVFQRMADARDFFGFIAGTGMDIEAQGDQREARVRNNQNGQAVFQVFHLVVWFRRRGRRLQAEQQDKHQAQVAAEMLKVHILFLCKLFKL